MKEPKVGEIKIENGKRLIKSKNGKWKRDWSKDELEQIRVMYCSTGKSLRFVADEMESSLQVIQALCNDNNWMRSKKEKTAKVKAILDANYDRMQKLYNVKNWTFAEISRKLGSPVTSEYVSDYMTARGHNRGVAETNKICFERGINKAGTLKHKKAIDKHVSLSTEGMTFTEYTRSVRKLTNSLMLDWLHIIDPENKRNKHYNIDHLFSIYNGYYRYNKSADKYEIRNKPIPLHVIAHPANLRILTLIANMQKHKDSVITLKQLKLKIEEFTDNYGDIYEIDV